MIDTVVVTSLMIRQTRTTFVLVAHQSTICLQFVHVAEKLEILRVQVTHALKVFRWYADKSGQNIARAVFATQSGGEGESRLHHWAVIGLLRLDDVIDDVCSVVAQSFVFTDDVIAHLEQRHAHARQLFIETIRLWLVITRNENVLIFELPA